MLFIEQIKLEKNSLDPKLNWIRNSKLAVEFDGSYLNQETLTYSSKNVVNLFIVYELDTC